MSPKKVFITGATGYIGGEVLHRLLHSDGDYAVTALVRSRAKGDAIAAKTDSRFQYVVGDLNDTELLTSNIHNSDIVINTADVDHLGSAEALVASLLSKKTPTVLVHTSGTSVVGTQDPATRKNVYSDKRDIGEINLLPLEQPHRPVDKLILESFESHPLVQAAIICPSNIFGRGSGLGNAISQQIPGIIRLALDKRQAFTVHEGEYIWSHIHIADLAELYYLVLQGLLEKRDIPKGHKGYYFGSYFFKDGSEPEPSDKPSVIEHSWRQVSEYVAQQLAAEGLVDTTTLGLLNDDDVKRLHEQYIPFSWGTNSRTRGDNGALIGWKPVHVSSEQFWKSIDEDIAFIRSAR